MLTDPDDRADRIATFILYAVFIAIAVVSAVVIIRNR